MLGVFIKENWEFKWKPYDQVLDSQKSLEWEKFLFSQGYRYVTITAFHCWATNDSDKVS